MDISLTYNCFRHIPHTYLIQSYYCRYTHVSKPASGQVPPIKSIIQHSGVI